MEGRCAAKGNAGELPAGRTPSRETASKGLEGIRETAKRDKRVKFTALLHHITPSLLVESFYDLNKTAAVGVDGWHDWRDYENILYERVHELHREITVKMRLRATLAAIRDKLVKKRHEPIAKVGAWLKRVVRGYFNYHAVPDNLKRLQGSRHGVCRAWFKQLRRRSQKDKMTWARFDRFARQYVPCPLRVHPYPPERFAS